MNITQKCMADILGWEKNFITKYFEKIMVSRYDYVIFLSRRSFVLFTLFAHQYEITSKIIVDQAIFSYRNELKGKKIAIVDDLAFTGNSMQNTIELIAKYCLPKEKIDIFIYAANKDSTKKVRRFKYHRKYLKTKIFSMRDLNNMKILSKKLVDVINGTGTPYVGFMNTYRGSYKDCCEFHKMLRKAVNKERISYVSIEDTNSSSETEDASDCWMTKYYSSSNQSFSAVSFAEYIRIYYNEKEQVASIVPFVFMKDISEGSAEAVFTILSQVFLEINEIELANKVTEYLNVEEQFEKEAYETLARVFSCFTSCACGILEGVHELLHHPQDNRATPFVNILDVNFNAEIAKAIKGMDYVKAKLYMSAIQNYFEIREDLFAASTSIEEQYEVDEMIKQSKNSSINIEHHTALIYEKMKIRSKNKQKERVDNDFSLFKSVKLIPLISKIEQYYLEADPQIILKEKIHFGQFTCLDNGIATYKFEYHQGCIFSICTLGEISALVSEIQMMNVIKEFKVFLIKEQNQMSDQLRKEKMQELKIRYDLDISDEKFESVYNFYNLYI
ncbi:MAG: phosphoribosyltransferase [Eubacteriales bacterium]